MNRRPRRANPHFVAALAMALTMAPQKSFAQMGGFYLENRSAFSIIDLYYTEPGTNEWFRLFGPFVVEAKSRMLLYTSGACTADVRVVFRDGFFEDLIRQGTCDRREVVVEGTKRQRLGLYVVNDSSETIERIRLATPGSGQWSFDLFTYVEPQERLGLAPPAGTCTADVRVEYRDGDIEELMGQAVCGGREVVFDRSRANRPPVTPPSETIDALPRPAPGSGPVTGSREREERQQAERARDEAERAREAMARAREETLAREAPARPPVTLPDFPWPPPQPSARAEVSNTAFIAPDNRSRSLAEVGGQMIDALDRAKYSDYSYYRAPGGFALVVRLERIADDGTPLAEQVRFLEPGTEEPFSLSMYVKRLFFAPEGFYRQIVFIVSDQPFTATGAKIDAKGAAELLSGGANRLSDQFDKLPFTSAHRVSALIYEFRKGPRDGDVAALSPGRLGARTHLERAGIYQLLVKTER